MCGLAAINVRILLSPLWEAREEFLIGGRQAGSYPKSRNPLITDVENRGITTINPIPERRHLRSGTSSRTNFDSVVDRFAQLLLASDVAFGGLDRTVPEKKLDLF
jgi:hypothetical protein